MEHFSAFVPAICAGLGLFLAGAANLVFVRRGLLLRAGSTIIAVGIALAISAQFEPRQILIDTTRLLAVAIAPFVLLSSGRFLRAANATLAAARRPAVRAAVLTVGGIGLAIGSVVLFERAEQRRLDVDLAELDLLHSVPPTTPSVREKAATDRGTPIHLRDSAAPRDAHFLTEAEARSFANSTLKEMVIRVSPADDRSNCHGWVFTGGRYLLRGNDVEVILKENNYEKQCRPRIGDLVIYRTAAGSITHTAVVQYLADGEPVLVKGKWGNLGVFTHPVDRSPYGTEFAYYRSPRAGHLLAISPLSTGEVPTTPTTE